MYLWAIFTNLHRARSGSGFGVNPIGWGELFAYSRLMGVQFQPWECEAIRALDDAYIETSTMKE